MRKVILAMFGLSLFILSSCRHDDPEPTTQQKLLGAWKLQKAVDEYYKPMTVLMETDETLGEPGDSVVFKNDNTVHTYSPIDGEDQTTYQVLNDTTIRIEDELYKIRKLTPSELNLYQELAYPATNEKYVQRIYFVR